MIEIKQLTWNENASDEVWWHGTFSSIDDIFAEAIQEGIKPGETIAIADAVPYMPQIDVSDVLEKVEQDAYEECGDAAEHWLEFNKGYVRSEELQIEMQRVFVEWLQKTNQMRSFYKLENIRTVVLKQVNTVDEKENWIEKCRSCQHCYSKPNDDYYYCRKRTGKCKYKPYKSKNAKRGGKNE